MSVLDLVFRSIELDIRFIRMPLSVSEKVEFISKKYALLLKNFLFEFRAGVSYITLFGKRYYYEDVFGIAFLQSVYVDNVYLCKFLSPGSVIVDIGANIGQFNFFANHFLKTDAIYSVEPLESAYTLLLKNAVGTTIRCAISSQKNLVLCVSPATTLTASSVKKHPKGRLQNVTGVCLDDVQDLSHLPVIDLLKIDVEGAELDVIQSGVNTIRKARYILVEVSSESFVSVVATLSAILPSLAVRYIGRTYRDGRGVAEAVDILFENPLLGNYSPT